MTSPAIQSNEKVRKPRNESEGSSTSETPSTSSVANILPSNGLFAWFRIFRLVDTLMRQGC